LIGLEDLVIPDEESRTKQYREIAQLVAEVPVAQAILPVPQVTSSANRATPAPNAASLGSVTNDRDVLPNQTNSAGVSSFHNAHHLADAGTGRIACATEMLPSVMPDEFADNHAVELQACMRWFSSDAGQVAKIEAPAGYANVRAHAMLHKSYLLKQQGALLQHPATLLPPRAPQK
jgi:hypothetical protein